MGEPVEGMVSSQGNPSSSLRSDAEIGALLERVRAAKGPDRVLDAFLCEALCGVQVDRIGSPTTWGVWSMEATGRPELEGTPESVFSRLPHYTGYVDAALALVERKLAGRGFQPLVVHLECRFEAFGGAHIVGHNSSQVTAKTAPLAIIAALLTALAARSPTPPETSGEEG